MLHHTRTHIPKESLSIFLFYYYFNLKGDVKQGGVLLILKGTVNICSNISKLSNWRQLSARVKQLKMKVFLKPILHSKYMM